MGDFFLVAVMFWASLGCQNHHRGYGTVTAEPVR